MTNEKTCTKCGAILIFGSELGAPGRGYSYDCSECGTSHHVVGSSCIPFEAVDSESLTYSIEDMK